MKSLITVSTKPWPGVDWVVPPMIKASVSRCSGADTEPGTMMPDASSGYAEDTGQPAEPALHRSLAVTHGDADYRWR